jgi:chemotaxis protein CheC
MSSTASPVNLRLQALQYLFSLATREASEVMSRWTGGLITLKLAEVREIPLTDACRELHLGDQRLTLVVLPMESEIGGVMIFRFDEEDTRQLAAVLMEQPPPTEGQWNEMEKSAVTETGNILGCAYLNAIARLIDRPMIPSAPYFLEDYGASVLQQALADQALSSNCVLIFRTGFSGPQKESNWCVLFVPTQSLCETMEKALLDVKSISP